MPLISSFPTREELNSSWDSHFYYPQKPPQSTIPTNGYLLHDLSDLFNSFGRWTYIWFENTKYEDTWFFPTYIGFSRVKGYVWNKEENKPEETELLNPAIDRYYTDLSNGP
ncbi:hypothetical protein ACVNS2_16435 [Paenibacillus caseinilyticus]|uniref:hypothetical protein n=1 Tax=Paenibacillus mucilaginosus TaxID=61624 RepID=UPI000FFEF18D|nr:hypothetical protein [Paenibacillus mucilaginosus]